MIDYTDYFGRIPQMLSTSKGVQPKRIVGDTFIKYDSNGYEGLCEIIAYHLLTQTNLAEYRYAEYYPLETEGCKSPRFAEESEIVTLYRALTHYYSMPLDRIIEQYVNTYDILTFSWYDFILDFIQTRFKYDARDFFSLLFEFDRLILNTDRHYNNIVFVKSEGNYSPIVFDHGAAFCSDKQLFNSNDILADLKYALCKPFNEDFDKQVELAQRKSNARLTFISKEIVLCISNLPYSEIDKQRVKSILNHQLNKYYPEVNLIWQ